MMNFSARLSLIFVLREGCFVMAIGYGSDIARISEKMRCEKSEFVHGLFIRWTAFQNRKTGSRGVAKRFSPNDRVRKVFEVFLLANNRRRLVVVFAERVSGVENHDTAELRGFYSIVNALCRQQRTTSADSAGVNWKAALYQQVPQEMSGALMAIECRCALVQVGLVHHSDRGIQYAADEYTSLLTQ